MTLTQKTRAAVSFLRMEVGVVVLQSNLMDSQPLVPFDRHSGLMY
jgi:hypothetical protein